MFRYSSSSKSQRTQSYTYGRGLGFFVACFSGSLLQGAEGGDEEEGEDAGEEDYGEGEAGCCAGHRVRLWLGSAEVVLAAVMRARVDRGTKGTAIVAA